MQRDIFFYWYRAIQDNVTRAGRYIVEDKRTGSIKVFIIKFTQRAAFKYHLQKVVDWSTLSKIYTKKNKNGCVAKMLVSQEKPVTVTYKVISKTLTIKFHYEVRNKYDIVCSF